MGMDPHMLMKFIPLLLCALPSDIKSASVFLIPAMCENVNCTLYREERSHIFLAQVAHMLSLALPLDRMSTTARLSQNICTFLFYHWEAQILHATRIFRISRWTIV